MAYIVSARKYRPSKFKDVVGQSSVSTTLKNAIKSGKLAQSFLFCGPRGVGKTTCARILAKVLNCTNITPDTEPCGECNSCQSFEQSASLNIFELDAASNNSVEDIRNLIEQVRFAPQSGKYKIYIIDEVHMLSQAAFNAFLKTLEEPPNYAIFILATTEKHKIIPTILSRCQIYDFGRIGVPDIVEHLQYVASDQQIEVETAALHAIARKADGGLRDSLSIFDRIASFSEGHITYKSVLDSLNILDYDYYFKATDAILAQDSSSLLLMLDEIMKKGFEGNNFINGLAEHFRNLLMCKEKASLQLLDVTENLKERYYQQALLAPSALLLSALNLTNDCDLQYRFSQNKRLHVELCLLKLCYIGQLIDVHKLAKSEPTVSVSSTDSDDSKKKVAKPSSSITSEETEASVSILKEPSLEKKQEQQKLSKVKDQLLTNSQAVSKPDNIDTKLNDLENEKKQLEPTEETLIKHNLPSTPPTSNKRSRKKRRNSKMSFSLDSINTNTLNTSSLQEPSTDNATNYNTKTPPTTENEEKNVPKLTPTILQKIWTSYTQQIDKRIVKVIFEELQPQLQNTQISITVEGQTQQQVIDDAGANFIKYLSTLGFNGYSFEVKVDAKMRLEREKAEKKSVSNYLKTDKEKLEEMVNDYPVLQKLINKLDLV